MVQWPPNMETKMTLTKHFSIEEMTHSDAAKRIGNSEVPGNIETANLRELCAFLEKIRKHCGNKPIKVHSGWRAKSVNRAVGGAPRSDHITGLAADISRPGWDTQLFYMTIVGMGAAGLIEYDQVILYPGHVHVSLGAKMRNEHWILS